MKFLYLIKITDSNTYMIKSIQLATKESQPARSLLNTHVNTPIEIYLKLSKLCY